MTPAIRTLVLIDTASRLATRIINRRRATSMFITDDIGPAEIEAFRETEQAAQVFASISAELLKPH